MSEKESSIQKNSDNKMSQQGHTKAELEHWETVMSEQLGEDASYNQPYGFLEKIHLGRMKIKQTDGHSLPFKQHPEHDLAVKNVKEREQQRVAEGNLRAGRADGTPSLNIVVSTGWLVDTFVVGQIVAMGRKINPRLLLANFWSASDDPPKVNTRAEGENTLTAKDISGTTLYDCHQIVEHLSDLHMRNEEMSVMRESAARNGQPSYVPS